MINIYKERYCFRCHKVKDIKEFNKYLRTFRDSAVCEVCRMSPETLRRLNKGLQDSIAGRVNERNKIWGHV